MKDLFIFILAFLSSCSLFSCSDENPSPADQGHNSDKGEVSFEISNDGGTGTGTSTSPAEVSKGDTLNMVISQKSSYTDSDGTVFECEPKATIELFAKLDTVYVEELSQLTNVQDKPEVQTSKEGQDPVVNGINQKFLIGEQYVNFDLAYEVYNYRTVDGETIEMPYVKLNQANFGSSGTTEASEPNARSETVIKSITVKPLPKTRASISDTTWYEVNAIFNLDIECMNARIENKQNLTFSVTYLGAVTREIELGEPVKELSSTISVLSGTNNTSSPFLANPQEVMSLLFKQNSSYTDSYGNKMTCEPEAKIRIFAQTDTIYAMGKEELEGVPTSQDFVFTASGEDPVLYSAVQLFELGSQNIQLEMSYEAYTAKDIENNEIEMPYLKQNATMPSAATVKELSTVTSSKADTTFYDVRVPIKLETINVGTEDENIQTIELVVSYIGAVVTLKEVPELVRVEYRTGYVWEEAHHNLPLLYYAKVYRDRYYSNGEVFTDEFVDNGHPADVKVCVDTQLDDYPKNYPSEGIFEYDLNDGVTDFITYQSGEVFENDSIRIIHCSATISGNPKEIQTRMIDGDRNNTPEDWDSYITSKLYDSSLDIAKDIPSNGIYSASTRQSGWYFQNLTYDNILSIILPNDIREIFISYVDVNQYDQYLVIDGRRIEFTDYYPKRENNFSKENIIGGVKFTHECIVKFMGRNFYSSNVMEITQRK